MFNSILLFFLTILNDILLIFNKMSITNIIIIIFFLILLFFSIKILQNIFLAKLSVISKSSKNDLDDFIYNEIKKIKLLFIFITIIYFTIHLLTLPKYIYNIFFYTTVTIWFLQITIILLDTINYLFDKYKNHKDSDKDITAISIIKGISIILTFLTSFFLYLNIIGIDISAILTGLGAIGIALAIALQNLISDIANSIILIFEKPFKIGDVIKLSSGEIGRIKSIGFKTTIIESFQGHEIVIPNKFFLDTNIQNLSNKYKTKLNFNIKISVSSYQLYENYKAGIRKLLDIDPSINKKNIIYLIEKEEDNYLINIDLYVKYDQYKNMLHIKEEYIKDIVNFTVEQNINLLYIK